MVTENRIRFSKKMKVFLRLLLLTGLLLLLKVIFRVGDIQEPHMKTNVNEPSPKKKVEYVYNPDWFSADWPAGMPTPNYDQSPKIHIDYENHPEWPRNPRNCSKPYCSLRYIPSNQRFSKKESQEQWEAVSQFYSLQIVHQTNLAKNSKRAWVTMITGYDYHYISSSFVMAKALREHRTRYPIVLLLTIEAFSFFNYTETNNSTLVLPNQKWANALYDLYDMLIIIPRLERNHYQNYWEKIFMFSLVQFEKLVWMGSDTVTTTNVDEMIDCRPPCGVYDQHLWQMDAISPIVNGDVLVFKPSLQDFVNFMDISLDPDFEKNGYDHSPLPPFNWYGPVDQGAINTYFNRYLTIFPKSYHLELQKSTLDYPEKNQFRREFTKLVHFAFDTKPWIYDTYAGMYVWCPILQKVWLHYKLDSSRYLCNKTSPIL